MIYKIRKKIIELYSFFIFNLLFHINAYAFNKSSSIPIKSRFDKQLLLAINEIGKYSAFLLIAFGVFEIFIGYKIEDALKNKDGRKKIYIALTLLLIHVFVKKNLIYFL